MRAWMSIFLTRTKINQPSSHHSTQPPNQQSQSNNAAWASHPTDSTTQRSHNHNSKQRSVGLETVRDVMEAFVIYSFLALVLEYCGGGSVFLLYTCMSVYVHVYVCGVFRGWVRIVLVIYYKYMCMSVYVYVHILTDLCMGRTHARTRAHANKRNSHAPQKTTASPK